MEERELIYSILYDCTEKGAFSNLALNREGIDDFVRAAVYGTLTYIYSEDFFIGRISGRPVEKLDPQVRTILRFGVWQLIFSKKVPDYAAVNTSVALASVHAPRAKSFVNAVLRKTAELPEEQKDINSYKDPGAAFSLKPEIYGVLKKSFGKERAPGVARSLLAPAPLAVRVNTLKTDRAKLSSALKDEGFDTEEPSFMKDALILKPTPESPSIERSEAFNNGWFMVQGEGAQLASVICGPQPGMKILDCCAAPGGKSTHLAALTGDKADILALDINSSRVGLIRQNAQRLGSNSVRTSVCDSVLFDGEDGFDIVLCDAPCSGLGIMGGKPDIRITITYERIRDIILKQRQILDNVSKLVKPGGTLVYSTCTLNEEENYEQVNDFLNRHEEFEWYVFNDILPQRLKQNENVSALTLVPCDDGCEGFFISRLRRKNG